jgi:prevent-host-death family protein
MEKVLSKARFKPQALKFLREVEKEGIELVITDHGRRVARVLPYQQDHQHLLSLLRGTVLEYVDPTEPVADSEWEALK